MSACTVPAVPPVSLTAAMAPVPAMPSLSKSFARDKPIDVTFQSVRKLQLLGFCEAVGLLDLPREIGEQCLSQAGGGFTLSCVGDTCERLSAGKTVAKLLTRSCPTTGMPPVSSTGYTRASCFRRTRDSTTATLMHATACTSTA